MQNKHHNQNTTNLQKFVIICSTCYPKWERSSATEELQPYTLLELLLPALPTFCKFHNNGCKIVMDSTKVIYHEEDCEFRNVSCIYRNCATKIMYKGTNTQNDRSDRIRQEKYQECLRVLKFALLLLHFVLKDCRRLVTSIIGEYSPPGTVPSPLLAPASALPFA